MLVVGEEGWPLEPDGHPSIKLKQITQWQKEGIPVRIVSESDWLRIVGLDGRCREVHSLYTPAMLCQSLNVPISQIRRWGNGGSDPALCERFIGSRISTTPRRPASADSSELLTAGIPLSQLESSLMKLQTMLPALDSFAGPAQPARSGFAAPGARRTRVVEPFTRRTATFDFAPPAPPDDEETSEPGVISDRRRTGNGEMNALSRLHWSADQWFEEGCRLLDEHETAAASIPAFLLHRRAEPGALRSIFIWPKLCIVPATRTGA